MNPRLRSATWACAAALGTALLALWAWLPYDPFEGPAPPLDRLVPRDADAVFRCDGPELLGSPLLAAVRDHTEGARLRDRFGFDERVLDPLRRVEAAFSLHAPGSGPPPSLVEDLLPAEVVVAVRGDDALLVTRISSRARVIDVVRRAAPETLRALGLRIDGSLVACTPESGAPPFWWARHRDALVAATSRALAAEALSLAADDGGHGAAPEFADALDLDAPARGRVLGWIGAPALVRWTRTFEGAGWRALLAPPAFRGCRLSADVSNGDALDATVELRWEGHPPPAAVAALEGAAAPPAPSMAPVGAWLAGDRPCVASGALAIRAAPLLEALLRSRPRELEDAAADAFAAAGETPASVAEAIAAHLEDGAAFGIARLPETDRVLTGDADPGAVEALPVTCVAFRMRAGAAGAAPLLQAIRTRAERILGEPLGDVVEVVRPGARVHALPRRGLGGQWELLRPCFSFADGWFVVASHDRFAAESLRRAPPPPAADGDDAGRGAAFTFSGNEIRLHVGDHAWAAADRATHRDWAAERGAAERRAATMEFLREEDRVEYVDGWVRNAASRRRTHEIPAAAEAWRNDRAWLGFLGRGTGGCALAADGARRTLRATLRLPLAE